MVGGDAAGSIPTAESSPRLIRGGGWRETATAPLPIPPQSVQPTAQGLGVQGRDAPLAEGLSLTQVLGDRLHAGHCLGVLAASHGAGRAPRVLGLREQMEQKRRITRDVTHEAALRV